MNIKPGDFTALAANYARFRPGYSQAVLRAIDGLVAKRDAFADVGAGTGIWTGLLATLRPAKLYAVEPNDAMRAEGASVKATWMKGSAEATGLASDSLDLVTMASSFHWADTEKALAEFKRILDHEGLFVALWNPRLTERSEIEAQIDKDLAGRFGVKQRVSSGRSGVTQRLAQILSEHFGEVLYLESEDRVNVPRERYIGAWESVNDVRSQLGEQKFGEFIAYVKKLTEGQSSIPVTYLTRAWAARKKS
jgi:ubiquinone/menaquinone biosynthesis C-methylase UbiE